MHYEIFVLCEHLFVHYFAGFCTLILHKKYCNEQFFFITKVSTYLIVIGIQSYMFQYT